MEISDVLDHSWQVWMETAQPWWPGGEDTLVSPDTPCLVGWGRGCSLWCSHWWSSPGLPAIKLHGDPKTSDPTFHLWAHRPWGCLGLQFFCSSSPRLLLSLQTPRGVFPAQLHFYRAKLLLPSISKSFCPPHPTALHLQGNPPFLTYKWLAQAWQPGRRSINSNKTSPNNTVSKTARSSTWGRTSAHLQVFLPIWCSWRCLYSSPASRHCPWDLVQKLIFPSGVSPKIHPT